MIGHDKDACPEVRQINQSIPLVYKSIRDLVLLMPLDQQGILKALIFSNM